MIKWRRTWLDSRERLITIKNWLWLNKQTNLKSLKQWWKQRQLPRKKESNSMNSDHNCRHYKGDWQIMLKLKQKKQLKTRKNHGAKQQQGHKEQWWHQIAQSTSMTLLESSHLQLVTAARELEACFLQTQIHLQWADRLIKEVHANGTDWWKKEKNCLRRVLTLRTIH